MLRVLDFEVRTEEPDNPYNAKLSPKAARGFTLALKVHCQECGLTDFVKISNMGWQGGRHADALARVRDSCADA
jgi:hypothetical protein